MHNSDSSHADPAPRVPRLLRPFLAFGPLAIVVFTIVAGLLLFFLFRAALTLTYWERFKETPEVLWLFPIGVRMDLISLCYCTIAPAIILLLLPKRFVQKIRLLLAAWFTMWLSAIVYMEIATFPFVDEYDVRPDQKFLEYLKHTTEVFTTLYKMYALELAVGAVALLVCGRFVWKNSNALLRNYREWSATARAIAFPFCIGLLFLGARSTLGHRPANLSTAFFSENHLANEFALNSTYSVLYSAYRMYRHEKNPSLDYGKMDRAEIMTRVKHQIQGQEEFLVSDIPFLRKQNSPFDTAGSRPKNIVIFLQESVGAVDTGCLKGPPITPNICRLKDEGMWFPNLYATGTRTVRGIEATVSGFLPTSAVGVLKLGLAQKNFFTAASLLAEHGYETDFFYGGMSNFDEMRAFFLGNGFQNIYDEPTFENPVFHGTWGVSDEDLVRKANQQFVAHGDKPFFALMLSTSNHSPYEFPDGRIDLYEQPKQTHLNAVKYADYAIGLFFELAKKEKYFEDTIFLVVADHNSHVRGNEHVPISKFQIPGFIVGPNVPKMSFERLASQIDLLPTMLHFTGIDTVHPMIGRNLMKLPADAPGRAFMQYGSNNAYMVGDDVVILRPFVPAEEYEWKNDQLVPANINDELTRDALAHAHLPWILYSEQLYKLPDDAL